MRNGIGFYEIVVILVLIVIFVDPKKIPDLIKKMVAMYRKIRKEFFDLIYK